MVPQVPRRNQPGEEGEKDIAVRESSPFREARKTPVRSGNSRSVHMTGGKGADRLLSGFEGI